MKDGMRMEVNRAFSEWRVEEGREGEADPQSGSSVCADRTADGGRFVNVD